MRYKLNVGLLFPGDIILVGYNDKDSREIQKRTNSKYSHAMLYWKRSIIHASDIVITANPSRMLFEEDEDVCILRLKDEFWNELRIECLINYARTFVGTFYDKRALVAMRDGKKVEPKENRQMCARFVAQCYDYVCLDLVDDYELCTPEDIFKSNILRIVDHPLLEANKDDLAFAESFDVTYLQFESIKKFLLSFKRRYPKEDVVSLNQLETFLEDNISESDNVLELLHETDYFDLWRLEKEHCRYLYDVDKFKKKWEDKDSRVKQALSIIKDCKGIIKDKENDILAYNAKRAVLEDTDYYREMIELRENVIRTAKERIAVAEQILLESGIVKIRFPWSL